jgi:ComF family protein
MFQHFSLSAHFRKNIQGWLLGGNCLLCTAHISYGNDLCCECERTLPRLHNACPRCAAPMGHAEAANIICGQCQQHPPAFAQTHATFAYAPPVDRLIQTLKYSHRLSDARVLGEYMAEHLASQANLRPDMIIPVPLHRARLRERGYNQSLELARPIARRLRLPLDPHVVRRVRATTTQTRLKYDERKKNVRGAFLAVEKLEGLRLAIVDDVMTSGHTANALAKCLRRAGAEEVVVWIAARAGG